jgi:hypothetical protein
MNSPALDRLTSMEDADFESIEIVPALAPGYAHHPITSSGGVIGRKTWVGRLGEWTGGGCMSIKHG